MAQIQYDLIRKPLITEKTTILSEQNKYVFSVASCATKPAVKRTIENIFEVKVKSVNILIQKGKVKKFKGTTGRRSDVKKAIVTLENGYNIDFTGEVK